MKQHLLLLFLCFCLPIFGQEEFKLAHQINGQVDFTMIGATMNSKANDGATTCDDYDLPFGQTASADLNLRSDQTIRNAYIYWSSNNRTEDREIFLNGESVLARSVYKQNISTYSFYSCFADVTDLVQAQGNTTYTVTGLKITRQDCTVSYGGWAMIVVYEDGSFTKNSVNIYEGFKGISGSGVNSIDIDISDLLVANDSGSKLGILAWEGDESISVTERVTFNGNVLSNTLNPGNNLFNGTNTFTNDSNLYNMDLDGFDIEDYVEVGDTSASIVVESGQDLVLMNVIAFTLNNELPDPTVEFRNLTTANCESDEVTIDFAVQNINSNDELDAGASVKLFLESVDSTPVAEVFTTDIIPIDGEETFPITIPIPSDLGDEVEIFAQVNLNTRKEPIMLELNPNNNTANTTLVAPRPYNVEDEATICANEEYTLINGETVSTAGEYTRTVPAQNGCDSTVVLTLNVNPIPSLQSTQLSACSQTNSATFTLSDATDDLNNGGTYTISYHPTEADAMNDSNELPNSYDSETATIWARAQNEFDCVNTIEVNLTVVASPTVNSISPYNECGDSGTASFDLTTKASEAIGSQNGNQLNVQYFTSEQDAEANENAIANPENYENTSNPQTIYVRLTTDQSPFCSAVGSFELSVNDQPDAEDVPIIIPTCSLSATAYFNLDDVSLQVAANNSAMQVQFYETIADAEAAQNEITNTSNYQSGTATIYGKVIDPTTGCFSIGNVQLQVDDIPPTISEAFSNCATNTDNDASVFDLTQFESQLLENFQNLSITYHTSQADAESGTNAISQPDSYESIDQTVYVRTESVVDGNVCYSVSEIEVTITPRPTAVEVTYNLCSSTSEQSFNLPSVSSQITNNEPNVDVMYYRTQTAADTKDASAQLPNDFISSTTTVYARLENSLQGCYSVTPLQLVVDPNPTIQENLTFDGCVSNGSADFDLVTLTANLRANYPTYQFAVYNTEADAESQSSPIAAASISESETKYIRINNSGSSCYSVLPIQLNVSPVPVDDLGKVVICLNDGYTLANGEQVTETGVYEGLIYDPVSGCDRLSRVELIVGDILFPNTFSPNNNGVNDVFRALPGEECIDEVSNYHLVIFNRWGEKVFETNEFTDGWHGDQNGRSSQDGFFIWRAEYNFQGQDAVKQGVVRILH